MKQHVMHKMASVVLALCVVFAFTFTAVAKYPEKTITIICPNGAGGGTDLVTRIIAKHLEKYLEQTVVVTNVTGQSGSVGGKKAADSKPDGYTLLGQHSGIICLYHAGLSKLNYTDYEPLAIMATGAEAIAVNVNSPWNTISDLIADARKRPGQIKYGMSIGSTSYFLAMSIMRTGNVKFQPVAYDGETERATALAGGHLDVISASFPSIAGYVKSGNIKILGVVDFQRNSGYPDIKTLKEQGVNVTDSFVARGYFAPKGLPADVKTVLLDALAKVAADPDFAKDLSILSYDPQFLVGDTLMQHFKAQDELVAAIVKENPMQKK